MHRINVKKIVEKYFGNNLYLNDFVMNLFLIISFKINLHQNKIKIVNNINYLQFCEQNLKKKTFIFNMDYFHN